MKNHIKTACKYIVPLTIIGLFGFHSYSVQSKLEQKEKQTYISLKELSEIAAKIHGAEPPFLDKVMITIVDWFIPAPFINKNESLKLLAKYKKEITSESKRIYVSESKAVEVVVTKNFNLTSSANESKSIPMGTILSAFVIAPFHDSDNPSQLRFKININSMSCMATADSILKTDYQAGTIVAKISGINCSKENSISMPLEAVGLVSGRVLS